MEKPLSEESLDLLRDMMRSEAWKIFERFQQERIGDSRVLATSEQTMLESPTKALWYAAEAQGRENSLTEIKDMCYVANTRTTDPRPSS